ncbi:MAG: hypothetical protein QOE72_2316 [Chloroflexota bacterium]|jgi:hypothetical protein|nr:hypothetical protein [Chloroflexota bacterium]
MTISRSTATALVGAALAGLLAACGSAGASSAGYVPLTASPTPAPATADPGQPAAQPAQVVPGAPQAPAGQPAKVVAPQGPPTDFSAIARSFVALRNQNSQALSAIKGQTSNSDLEVDKRVMAQAATIFATYVQQLRALPFPASMKADAGTLVTAVSTVQATFVQASQVASFNDLGPLLQKLIDTEDVQLTATNVIENDLHLPLSTPRP